MTSLRASADTAGQFLRQHLAGWAQPAGFLQFDDSFEPTPLLDRVLGEVPLGDLPGMPPQAHPSSPPRRLLLGECGRHQLLVAAGHWHLYDGAGSDACVLPVCAAAAAGVTRVFLFGSASGIREDLKPGTVLVLTDYLNNLGSSPLVGNLDLGPDPFLDPSLAFSQELNSGIVNAASESGLNVRLGTLQADLGPQFATPPEVAMAQRNGADALGDGIVLETLAACAMECQVMAAVVIANRAATHRGRRRRHSDALETAQFISRPLVTALRRYWREL